jgi:hypothetical protein
MTRDYLKEMKDNYDQAVSSDDPSKKKTALSFCPSIWNRPCRLCDACKEVLFHQDSHTAQEIEQARELNRKPKFYANIMLVSNPNEVVLFEYGKTIGDKLGIFEMDDSSEFKGFSNPKFGRNIVVVKYPHPEKRKTRYDIEPRIASSSLPNMEILNHLYDLDDVPGLLAKGIPTIYQSKLVEKRTEIRWLPYWNWKKEPALASVFQVKYFIHYHTSEEELAAINRGEFNPLKEGEAIVSPPQEIIIPAVAMPTEIESTDVWGALQSQASGLPIQGARSQAVESIRTEKEKPACFGTWDDEEPVCVVKCVEKRGSSVFEECKAATRANLEARRKARGLYR